MIQTDELKSVLKKKKRSAAEASLPEKEKKRNKKRKKAKELEGKCDYYIHMETSNVSFLKMYKVLKSLGVENNKFHLALYDKTLRYVDPYSPDLTIEQKTRIIIECKRNLWYYIREVARIVTPGSGIAPGKGKRYQLHRGNMALTFCVVNNLNSYTEMPRQSGKSISVDVVLLWLLLFGTNTSKMIIMNKDHDGAKDNIIRMQEMRECLPIYLQGLSEYNDDGKKLKASKNKEYIEYKKVGNRIDAKASPRDPASADNMGRGNSTPMQWYDEIAYAVIRRNACLVCDYNNKMCLHTVMYVENSFN